MARRLTRPRSNSERGRASRLRAAESIGKRDAVWLARYERDVAAHKAAKAAGLRLPRGPRARSNTERGRASKLRAKARVGALTRSESRFLRGYERAVQESREVRDVRRARKRRRRPAADARALAEALAEWMGGDAGSRPTSQGRRSGGASHETMVDWAGKRGSAGVPNLPPHLAPHLSGGHAMSVRMELQQPRGMTRWVTVLAYSNDSLVASVDLWKETAKVLDAYRASKVLAVNVIVGPE